MQLLICLLLPRFTDLTYRTITLTEPWKSFWGVDGLSFTYGNDDDTSKRTRLILGGIGFMDTGTSSTCIHRMGLTSWSQEQPTLEWNLMQLRLTAERLELWWTSNSLCLVRRACGIWPKRHRKDGTVTISKAKFSKLQSLFVKINNVSPPKPF